MRRNLDLLCFCLNYLLYLQIRSSVLHYSTVSLIFWWFFASRTFFRSRRWHVCSFTVLGQSNHWLFAKTCCCFVSLDASDGVRGLFWFSSGSENWRVTQSHFFTSVNMTVSFLFKVSRYATAFEGHLPGVTQVCPNPWCHNGAVVWDLCGCLVSGLVL